MVSADSDSLTSSFPIGFSFLPWSMMLAVGLSYIDFIMLEYIPSMLTFWRVFFNHKLVLNFGKSHFFIYWDYHMVFIFQFVNMVYHIDWFAYIEESLHKCKIDPGINTTWSWCVSFLMCCWILFAKILLRIFHVFISDIGL